MFKKKYPYYHCVSHCMKHHASTNLVAHEPFILLEVRELLLKLTVLICESLYLGTRSILHCNVVSGV